MGFSRFFLRSLLRVSVLPALERNCVPLHLHPSVSRGLRELRRVGDDPEGTTTRGELHLVGSSSKVVLERLRFLLAIGDRLALAILTGRLGVFDVLAQVGKRKLDQRAVLRRLDDRTTQPLVLLDRPEVVKVEAGRIGGDASAPALTCSHGEPLSLGPEDGPPVPSAILYQRKACQGDKGRIVIGSL